MSPWLSRRRCHCCRRRRHRGWRGCRLRWAVGVGVGVGVGVAFARYSISCSGKEHLEFLDGLISRVGNVETDRKHKMADIMIG